MSSSNLPHVILISGATILSGIVNYLYHPLMLRYMDISDFGVFASLVSITNILSILIVGVSLFLTREYSRTLSDMPRIRALTISALSMMLGIGMGMLTLYLLLSWVIGEYLQIDESWGTWLVGLTLPLACVSAVYTALLRSMRRYVFLSSIQVLAPVVKLAAWYILVMAGYGVAGAVGGLVIAWVATMLFSTYYIYRIFLWVSHESTHGGFVALIRREGKWVIGFVVGSVVFTFLMNADVLLVKNLYSPDVAWVYAGVAVLGKFLVFLLMSLETVYYGQIMEHTQITVPRRLILEPLGLIAIVSLVSIVGTYWIWEYALTMMKSELSGQAGLLMLLVVYSGILAYVSLVSKVLIGWGNRLTNPILMLGAGVLLSLVYLLPHESLTGFAMLLIIPVVGIALALSVVLGWGLLRGRG